MINMKKRTKIIIVVMIIVLALYSIYVFNTKMTYCGNAPFFLPNTYDCVG